MADVYRFDRFVLDPADRRLFRDGQPVDLSGRYLDALVLLVAEDGRLVTKSRFLDEVWKGVPVTEEALSQCIRSLRKVLGDEAGQPRFIETVPRHGYRFAAPVTLVRANRVNTDVPDQPPTTTPGQSEALAQFVGMGRAGLFAGGAAGLVGGLLYGLAGVADGGAGGAVSGLLVLAAVTAVVGLIGGAGVGLGVGTAGLFSSHSKWLPVGGAFGGLVVGAVVRLAGSDALSVLFGAAPRAMTGAGEGVLLGAAIGAGVWIARGRRRRTALLAGAVMTGGAGASIALLGGQLMGGSLAGLAAQFPLARLNLDQLGTAFGEGAFGPVSQTATAGLEAALFGAAMVLALSLEQRRSTLEHVPRPPN